MKNWLERNKIYFETIAPVLLSVSAVFVSISSYLLTQKQVELSSLEAQPHFYLKEAYLYDEALKRAYETELRIYNSGADISNFKKNLNSIIEVEFYTPAGKLTGYVPLYGYYNGTYSSSDPSGELALIKGHLNNNKYHEVYFAVQSSEFRDKYGTIFLSLKHGVDISYTNKLGEQQNAYFIDNKPVPQSEYEAFMSNFSHNKAIDLSELTAETIAKTVESIRSPVGE
ncbi:hypothetical protein [Vibrio cidicii]|uniref:hypothetical protein n=1 Tax=Vibrio cidicii TaxID=1763883 RepID=UPI0018C1D71C|nr:hypothetical protein [Vibrio cidicii]